MPDQIDAFRPMRSGYSAVLQGMAEERPDASAADDRGKNRPTCLHVASNEANGLNWSVGGLTFHPNFLNSILSIAMTAAAPLPVTTRSPQRGHVMLGGSMLLWVWQIGHLSIAASRSQSRRGMGAGKRGIGISDSARLGACPSTMPSKRSWQPPGKTRFRRPQTPQ